MDAQTTSETTLGKRLLKFGFAIFALVLVVNWLAPLPVQHISPFGEYARHADENNIHPGALYYTDVSVSAASERNSRDSVRFTNLQKEHHPGVN